MDLFLIYSHHRMGFQDLFIFNFGFCRWLNGVGRCSILKAFPNCYCYIIFYSVGFWKVYFFFFFIDWTFTFLQDVWQRCWGNDYMAAAVVLIFKNPVIVIWISGFMFFVTIIMGVVLYSFLTTKNITLVWILSSFDAIMLSLSLQLIKKSLKRNWDKEKKFHSITLKIWSIEFTKGK